MFVVDYQYQENTKLLKFIKIFVTNKVVYDQSCITGIKKMSRSDSGLGYSIIPVSENFPFTKFLRQQN